MQAVILEDKGRVRMGDIAIEETLGDDDVRIKPLAVGICGSDVHYFREGRIGDFVVEQPMVLGHEASGIVVEAGRNVRHLSIGDRVCMEPGIPNFKSPETLKGMYNINPDVKFWATPPVHGCLRETVVHPACLTFPIPDSMSFAEGALVEPVAIGVYSVEKAEVSPGDAALVMGSGTIGIVTALAAEAAGCAPVILADIKREKLDFVEKHYGNRIVTAHVADRDIVDVLGDMGLAGVDLVFEASGAASVYPSLARCLNPGGTVIFIGMPSAPASLDIVAMQVKEITTKSIFRYVNAFPKTVSLIASGKLDVAPLVTKRYPFAQAVEAFSYAGELPADEVKILIEMDA